jgi:hypothetical protein
MTNTISANPAQVKHKETITIVLARRLKIAKADRNFELLELLEQERQQLERSYQQGGQQKQNFWNWLLQPAQVSIKPLDSTAKYFRGYNPIAGEIRYGNEADMIDWMEE